MTFREADFFQMVVRLPEIHLVDAVNLDLCIGQGYQLPSIVSSRLYPHEWAEVPWCIAHYSWWRFNVQRALRCHVPHLPLAD